jgi:hypothetical protein
LLTIISTLVFMSFLQIELTDISELTPRSGPSYTPYPVVRTLCPSDF